MENFWSDFLQNLVLAAVPIVVPFVIALLVAKIRLAWLQVDPNITYVLVQAAEFAVTAAEQAGASQYIKDKKAYALEIAQAWLDANKIKVDLALIDAAIESAVYNEFNKEKIGSVK
jgi:hypothetical protein